MDAGLFQLASDSDEKVLYAELLRISVLTSAIRDVSVAPSTIGEMAEWSNAVVLKTIEPKGSGGSNPSLSATFEKAVPTRGGFFCLGVVG